MNNKKLAIVLSIIAIVLVIYQFFLKKDENGKIKRNINTVVKNQNLDNPGEMPDSSPTITRKNPSQVAQNNQPVSSVSTNTQVQNRKDIIDFNSEILLVPVYENSVKQAEKKELPEEIGIPIFVKEIYQQKSSEKARNEYVEVVFKLNAIIIKQEGKYVIINNKILKVGEMVDGAIVKDIKKSKVLLEFNGKEIILSTNSKIKKIRYLGGRSEK